MSIILTLLISLSALSQSDTSLRKDVIVIPCSSHWSGRYENLNENGRFHYYDDCETIKSRTTYGYHNEDSTVYLYRLTTYYENGNISYDSILDFREKAIATITVHSFYENGKKKRVMKMTAEMDPNRTSIPAKKDLLWNGKEKHYNKKGRKLRVELLENICHGNRSN
ncbi:MAG: hypothetical protein MK105_17925 [Crocinitomicaceae bacterium]|nr:hypothetical protein [Crocinitomicaceae bacterium]